MEEAESMNILIPDPYAKDYKKVLEKKFPELPIHAAMEKEIGDFIKKAEILLAGRISDEVI